jgi:hypothetical protein
MEMVVGKIVQLTQRSLFGEPAIEQPAKTMLDTMTERKAAMGAAFEHADERFKEEYLRLVMRFVEQGKEFIGEDVQKAYKKERPRLPLPREWRCVGAIYQGLIRKGTIVRIGYGKRNQGNATAIYKGVRNGD